VKEAAGRQRKNRLGKGPGGAGRELRIGYYGDSCAQSAPPSRALYGDGQNAVSWRPGDRRREAVSAVGELIHAGREGRIRTVTMAAEFCPASARPLCCHFVGVKPN
jgi:hypothetical protein